MNKTNFSNHQLQHTSRDSNITLDHSGFDAVTDATIWYVVTVILCIIGSLLNLSLSIAMLRNTLLRGGAGLLVVHLLLLQCLDTTLCIPFYASVFYVHFVWNWSAATWVCQLLYTGYTFAFYGTIWADFTLAANRFVAVFDPHGYQKYVTKSVVLSQILVIWAMCFALGALPLFGVTGTYGMSRVGNCGYFQNGSLADLRVVLGAYLPLTLVALSYCAIGIHLCYDITIHGRKVFSIFGGTSKRGQRRRDLAGSLMLLILWQTACYLPANYIVRFAPWVLASQAVSLWIRTLIVIGAAFSPVILLMANDEYKKAYMDFLDRMKAMPTACFSRASRNRLSPSWSSRQPNAVN